MKRAALAALILLAALPALAIGPKDGPGGAKNVAILLFPGVQIIDYTGPWEVLGHARVDGKPAFKIYSVAETASPFDTAMGMTVIPSYTFAKAPKPDVLVLPGGNVDPQLSNEGIIRWIRESAKTAEVVLSVCNGAFFLAEAGLLDGLEATTFAGMIDDLQRSAPKTKVVRDKRFVDNGKIITSAGLSSGIDGALHVIEKLYGKGTAQLAAVGMEYDWRPDSGWARASLADMQLFPAFAAVGEYSETRRQARGNEGSLGDELEGHHDRERADASGEHGQGLRGSGLEAAGARSVPLRGRRRSAGPRRRVSYGGPGTRTRAYIVTTTVARAN